MATHDESLYPPSCCKQRIYVLSVRAFLPPSVVGAYVRKAREYETRHHVDEEPAAEGDEGLRGSEVEVHGSSRKPDILCSVCRNEVRGGYTAPCGHTYDRDCLSGLFRMATHDESLYPPSCCKQRIYVLSVRAFLPPSVVGAYVKKAKEYETRCRIGKESLVESESGKVHGDKKIQVHDSTRKTSILCVNSIWKYYSR
ncbi:hypothetical protein BC629DRAFT_92074 [Irpex lacteus]|nr:hypothetical protein BC629DRAFT_92074 [Irpex lacteus]